MTHYILPALPSLAELLVSDDGARYLNELTPEQRRPYYVRNKLPEVRVDYTAEQRRQADDILTPDNIPGEWPDRA